MGYDMLVYDLYLPAGAGLDTAAAKAAVRDLCRHATLDDLRVLLDQEWITDDRLADPQDWTDEALTGYCDVLRAAAEDRLLGLLEHFATSLHRRDVARFRFDRDTDGDPGVDAYVTGGLSAGDCPTGAFEAWDIVCGTTRFPDGWPGRIGAACGLLHPRGTGPAVTTVTFHTWAVPASGSDTGPTGLVTPAQQTTAQHPGPRSELVRITLRELLDLLDGHLLPAGPAGGPPWTTAQRADLWHSIESGWPLGLLTCWAPPGSRGTWHLLDGHRRVATIREATAAGGTPLWRDVEQNPAVYHDRPAGPRGWLPTTAVIRTLDFLHATRHWPQQARHRAEDVATAVLHAPIDLLILTGGQPQQVRHLCGRLLGERVDAATLATVPEAGNPPPR